MDEFYHGTSKTFAAKISKEGINPTLGGGELGQGFYVSDKAYVTFNWADKCFGINERKVMKFLLKGEDFFELNPLQLDYNRAVAECKHIRDLGATRSYRFNRNIVWSEIVGIESIRQDQFKFETDHATNKLQEV